MHTGKGGRKYSDGEAGAKFVQLKRVCGCSAYGMVGERRMRGEVRAEALVDFIRVRMPE